VDPVLVAAPIETPLRKDAHVLRRPAVQVRVTSRTVAKKVCPVADRVIVPGGGGGGGGGGAGDGWEAWPPR
jgi:hypothetical protein